MDSPEHRIYLYSVTQNDTETWDDEAVTYVSFASFKAIMKLHFNQRRSCSHEEVTETKCMLIYYCYIIIVVNIVIIL